MNRGEVRKKMKRRAVYKAGRKLRYSKFGLRKVVSPKKLVKAGIGLGVGMIALGAGLSIFKGHPLQNT